MQDITVRKGKNGDLEQVLDLIRELAEFEKAPQEVTNSVKDMLADFDNPNPVFRLLVAETADRIVGMAIYFIKYSTWKGRGVYLDDILVTESMRGKGIGTLLFDEVVRDAARLGAKQMHWQVLDWNEPAIEFYKKYDSSFDSTWVDCKLTEEQIRNFSK